MSSLCSELRRKSSCALSHLLNLFVLQRPLSTPHSHPRCLCRKGLRCLLTSAALTAVHLAAGVVNALTREFAADDCNNCLSNPSDCSAVCIFYLKRPPRGYRRRCYFRTATLGLTTTRRCWRWTKASTIARVRFRFITIISNRVSSPLGCQLVCSVTSCRTDVVLQISPNTWLISSHQFPIPACLGIHCHCAVAGASKEAIAAIPTVTLPGGGAGPGEDADPRCSICLADYVAGATLRKLPCGHQFHRHVVSIHIDYRLKLESRSFLVDPRCSICLADYVAGATLRKLPCGHQLHRSAPFHVFPNPCPGALRRRPPILHPLKRSTTY